MYTATAGQTVFTGSDDNSQILTFDNQSIMVTYNGVMLEKGSEFTVAANTVTLLAGAEVNAEVNVIVFNNVSLGGYVKSTGGDIDGNLSFGDNDKAKFGAGDDLQIYHDGSNSYIDDAGSGDLYVRASGNLRLTNSNGADTYAHFQESGYAKLYHNGSEKLATTSTGVDVTGSASTDGITITNPLSGSFYNAKLEFTRDGTSGGAKIQSERNSAGGVGMSFNYTASNTAEVNGTYTKAMTIESSGRVLVGKTASGMTSNGVELRTGVTNDYAFTATSLNQPVMLLNRQTDDGTIIRMRKANSDVGFIGTLSGSLYIGTTYSNDSALRFSGGTIHPCNNDGSPRDNGIYLGYASGRFTVIYAVNGTIQTSDQTEKQDIASLTATEMLVAKRISALFKNYRWIDKVTVEGDDARTHSGVIAQDVQAAFTAEGLDASNYGLFCSDTWWEHGVAIPAVEAAAEVTDEDGNVTTEAVEAKDAYTRIDHYHVESEAPEGSTERTRLGIRYPELLSFVAAYNEQRFASIEARLAALEA